MEKILPSLAGGDAMERQLSKVPEGFAIGVVLGPSISGRTQSGTNVDLAWLCLAFGHPSHKSHELYGELLMRWNH